MTTIFTEGKIKPAVVGGKIADTEDLDGAFVKSVSADGTQVMQQDADGEPQTIPLGAGLSNVDRHDLDALPGLSAKTADLEVEATERTWGDVTDLDEGGYVSNSSGSQSLVQAAALAYVLSSVPTPAEAGRGYVYIKIPAARSSRDYRIRQHGNLGTFFITSWDHVGLQANFDYFRSRHNLFSGYAVTIQYDALTAFRTHYRGKTDASDMAVDAAGFEGNLAPGDNTVQKVAEKVDDIDLSRANAFTATDEGKLDGIADGATASHRLDASEANDATSDVFGETSGRLTAGAIDAHHTNQYTWLTELRLDYRNPQAGPEPQFIILQFSASERGLDFEHLTAIDRTFVENIAVGDVIGVGGSLFTVGVSIVFSDDELVLRGAFDVVPALVNGQEYRLRFTTARPIDNDAADIDVDTANLDGNLNNVDGNAQAMFEAVDDLPLTGQGAGNWGALPGRPDRPTAAELAAGTSTDEAVSSVSDVVALVNTHRLARSNADPENVGNAAAEGTEAAVSRRDHVHRFPHDSTMEYDAANDQFGVSVHDVIEHLQESVEYYTSSPYDYSQGGGASEGEVYTTSDFHKRITRIRFRFLPVPGTRYEARILQVNSDSHVVALLGTSQFRTLDAGGSHHFNFSGSDGEAGVLVPASTRIAIVLSRLGGGIVAANTGAEAGNSPNESYDDASQDFVRQNSVVYDAENPPVGEHTHSHSDDIRGNIQISYTLTYNHGRFVGDNFELSDAVPQESTTDGSAGVSEEASRADHAHPETAGGGGAASLGGNTAETLFDNRAPTETALSVLAGSVDWSRTIDFGFTRALVEADDDKDLRIRFQITQSGQIRHFGYLTSAETFRLMPEYTASSGSVLPTTGHLAFEGADGRTSRTATSLFSRLNIGVRQRTAAGEDALRLLLSLSGNSHVSATNIRGIIELVPRAENLTIEGGGGGGEQQQSIGGRNLATREIVAGDTLIAANNFDFDLSGDDQIAVGRYALAPTPRSNIFDFVATVRVGGRAGYQLHLSKEQFDYVGEFDIQNTWPFGGTGGGSWGNVTEIPCAMLFVNHRSEGVSKTQLRPQRQQIGWTIDSQGTAATAILFFFSYNTSGQVDFIEMIVFTDQVVEIEGIHFHYWEDA